METAGQPCHDIRKTGIGLKNVAPASRREHNTTKLRKQ
jgi:hypothetical protein